MILLLWLACEAEPVDSAAPEAAFAPTWGAWTAGFDSTWSGDCELADTNTYLPAETSWVLEPYRDGFGVRDLEGYWTDCALEDHDFSCALPVISDDFTSIFYDVMATYTPTWSGSFDDEAHLSGSYEVAAECVGDDCDQLTGYGADFEFPCTAVAGLEASLDG